MGGSVPSGAFVAAAAGARIAWDRPERAALAVLLDRFGGLLPEPLSARMDLDAYAAKLLERAEIAVARRGEAEAGLLLLYANDDTTRRAHVPAVAVAPEARGAGLGRALMTRAMAEARRRGMTALDLTVTRDNAAARALYEGVGFRTGAEDGPRLRMQAELPP